MNDSSTPADLLDRDQLAIFADFGLDDFKEILDEMMADVPGILAQLNAAMTDGDEVGGKRAAHLLRGMLLNFGCSALAARLLEIEHRWIGSEESAPQIGQELEKIWQDTLLALDGWVAATYQ